jgi:hypothetical protein
MFLFKHPSSRCSSALIAYAYRIQVSNPYSDPSSAYTYIGLGNGTVNGHSRAVDELQQQNQQRYSAMQQQKTESNYDYALESQSGTFSPQPRNFISRHQLIQQQDQVDQRTRSPSTDSSQIKGKRLPLPHKHASPASGLLTSFNRPIEQLSS